MHKTNEKVSSFITASGVGVTINCDLTNFTTQQNKHLAGDSIWKICSGQLGIRQLM